MSSKNHQKAGLTKCLCGCEQLVRGNYKQGHDAKHVSNLLQGIVEGRLDLAQAQDTLPSWKLQAKLAAAVTRRTGLRCDECGAPASTDRLLFHDEATGLATCDGCQAAQADDIESATEVKIGRWWYQIESAIEDGGQARVTYRTRTGETKTALVDPDQTR